MNQYDADSDDCHYRGDMYHSGSGQWIDPIRNTRKISTKKSFRQLRKDYEDKFDFDKGYVSEDRFAGMVNMIIATASIDELIGIRKATRNQDQKHKIDFWLIIGHVDGYVLEVAVQVKSSWTGAEKFILEHPDRAVDLHIVVMDDEVTLLRLVDRIRKIVSFEKRRK